jgi:hypothetical protein
MLAAIGRPLRWIFLPGKESYRCDSETPQAS